MAGILIVDDTPLIRSAFHKVIRESDLGLEPIREAADGNEALRLVEQEQPEIILMDIRMPSTNGLLASEEILRRFPGTHIVIVTAYSEFSYAQKALRLGIHEFLLKPVRPSRLLTVLGRLKAEIEQQKRLELTRSAKAALSGSERPQEQERLSRRFVETTLMQHLTRGSAPEDYSVQTCLTFLEKKISNPVVLAFEFHRAAAAEGIDATSSYAELAELVEQAFPTPNAVVVGCQSPSIVIAIVSTDLTVAGPHRVQDMAYAVGEKVAGSAQVPVRVGVGRVLKHLHQIPMSFADAFSALRLRDADKQPLLLRKPGSEQPAEKPEDPELIPTATGAAQMDELVVSVYTETSHEPEHGSLRYLEAEKRLIEAVRNEEQAEAEKRLNQLLDQLEQLNSSTFQSRINHCAEILGVVGHEIGSTNHCEREMLGALNKLVAGLEGIENQNLLRNWAITSLKELFAVAATSTSERDPVQTALDYLHAHYSSPEISLQDLADAVNLSPSYLASRIRAHTGMSYVKNLTAIRINNAKRLLRRTNFSVADIAFMVGYRNVTNFYRLFQREVELTPGAFREKELADR